MDKAGAAVTTIVIGIIGLAIVSVIISKNSQASQVIQSFGAALTSALQIAETPITANQGAAASATAGVGATGGATNNNTIVSQLSGGLSGALGQQLLFSNPITTTAFLQQGAAAGLGSDTPNLTDADFDGLTDQQIAG
jgi:hypothetical protein